MTDFETPALMEDSHRLKSCTRLHLQLGWWSLMFFVTLGIFLETMHGLKVGWYLDEANSTRRLMLTLAHAHGTLLALIHVAFAVTVPWVSDWNPRSRTRASRCLIAAGVFIPAGFFLGGLFIYSGDPGLGILLLPLGALFLLAAVLLTARGIKSPDTDSSQGN